MRRAPPQHRGRPGVLTAGRARHLGRLLPGAREHPVCAEGWAMWALGGSPDLLQSHRGYLPVGDAARLNLPVGPPLGAPRRCLRGALAPRSRLADSALGNSGGESRCVPRQDRRTPDELRGHAGLAPADPVTRALFRPETRAVGLHRRTIVTWLILPVVICLSQRLSHACLSISNYTAKLRMAH